MTAHRPSLIVTGLLAIAMLVAACGGSSGPLGSVPVASATAEPSVAQGRPDVTPAPAVEPRTEPAPEPGSSDGPGASPSQAPTGTTIVRTYFWLGGPEGTAGLVATLREIPGTKAVATAAVNALLAGTTSGESSRNISTSIPEGTQLLGLKIEGGVATIDLSSEFQAGGGGDTYRIRLGQVVYTLTQFPSVNAVALQIEGEGDATILKRTDFVEQLPAIWVDRPAWNAAIGNPAHVTGNSNVFEATFRISILDGSGKVIADQQVMATCGTGCRGTFDTSIAYDVAKAQYGTLHAYEPSAKDGSPVNVRDYLVWLTPKR